MIEIIFFSLIFFILIFSILFEKLEKGKKFEQLLKTLICLGISIMLIVLAVPRRTGKKRIDYKKKFCYSNQRLLLAAIESYDMKSKVSFPENCNKNNFIKLLDDLLVKKGYLKSKNLSDLNKNCEYELKNKEIICNIHQKWNKDIEKSNKSNIFDDDRFRILLSVDTLLGFIAAFKFFIFIFLS